MPQQLYRIRTHSLHAGTIYMYVIVDSIEQFLEQYPRFKEKGAYTLYENIATYDNYTNSYIGF